MVCDTCSEFLLVNNSIFVAHGVTSNPATSGGNATFNPATRKGRGEGMQHLSSHEQRVGGGNATSNPTMSKGWGGGGGGDATSNPTMSKGRGERMLSGEH